ncbi:MAG TPA: hypothetical protein VM555_10765, partial [Tahibacter sp.]|nr:hypothetical protein [Tahibacter sp.]
MRTNTGNSPSIDASSPDVVGSALDLAKLDAEASADADRWSRSAARIVGPMPAASGGIRRSAVTKAVLERSMFQRMIDSFFGVADRR